MIKISDLLLEVEAMTDKELIGKLMKPFHLTHNPKAFANSYNVAGGKKASSKYVDQINLFIQKVKPGTKMKAVFDNIYNTVRFVNISDSLNEISFELSNSYDYKFIGGSDPSYEFTTDTGTEYTVAFKRSHEDEGMFERVYYPTNKEFKGHNTKEGKALPINITVMKITLDFLERNKEWNLITIDPISDSRRRMVMRLLEMHLPDKYSFEEMEGKILIYAK